MREVAPSTTREPDKQRSWRHHPEVHSPAVRHVVEDGTRASLVVDPRQQGDGIPGVQATSVGEEDVAVASPVKLVRAVTCAVWSFGGADVTEDSTRIATAAYIFASDATVERENSDCSRSNDN